MIPTTPAPVVPRRVFCHNLTMNEAFGDESVFEVLPVVHSMGTMLFDPVWAERQHFSNRCELLYVINGAVQLMMERRSYPAGPGDVLLIPTGVIHRDVFNLAQGLEVFMVVFTWTAETPFFERVTNESIHRIPAHRKAEIARLLDGMRRDGFSGTGADHLLAHARLLTVLTLLLRESLLTAEPLPKPGHSTRTTRRRALMEEAKRFLDNNYAQPISLDDIARELDVSPFYLSHIFSEENDFSLFAYLTTLRMTKARSLLRAGNLHVAEVAQAVGYENGNYFSKVFRKYFGCSPSSMMGK